MKTHLYAFSLEQDPHIIVAIWFKLAGATDSNTFLNFSGQSPDGKTPRAGLFIRAF